METFKPSRTIWSRVQFWTAVGFDWFTCLVLFPLIVIGTMIRCYQERSEWRIEEEIHAHNKANAKAREALAKGGGK